MAKKRGCKGKYEYWIGEDGLIKIEGWARDGLIDKQIAEDKIGINEATLCRWKEKFPQIMHALKRGKEVVDREVESALLKRALGYETVETIEEPVKDKETGEIKMEVTKRIVKQVVPDTTAQIFWLKNRKPDEFRDKRDVELSGNVDFSSVISKARERMKHGGKEIE